MKYKILFSMAFIALIPAGPIHAGQPATVAPVRSVQPGRFSAGPVGSGQPVIQSTDPDAILAEIEANNPELKALAAELEARGADNLAAVALADPDIEFAYLFGPSEIGRRRDFSVSQSFDFATLSGTRRKVVLQENELLALELRSARRDILTAARKLICEIIARNVLIAEYAVRAEQAALVEEAYRKGMDSGAFSMLDYRKAAVDLAEAEGNLKLLETERQSLLAELTALNGGHATDLTDTAHRMEELPGTFEDWLDKAADNSSALAHVRAATRLQESRLQLSRNESLPGLSVGYMSELVPGEEFRGLKIGVSIPLWSSARKISGARKQLEAAQIAENQAALLFRIKAKTLYDNALQLREAADRYDTFAYMEDTRRDLEKALSAGNLSLLDYLTELSFFYKTLERAVETEKQYRLAVADLLALEM